MMMRKLVSARVQLRTVAALDRASNEHSSKRANIDGVVYTRGSVLVVL
jgi:hypothetical protein